MDTTLVVMAAGMGSRFGGLKQIEPMGKNGEIILDFSVFDAVKAGFNKTVFIIKKEIEHDFRIAAGKRIEKMTDVDYVFQEIDSNLPEGFVIPEGRTKDKKTQETKKQSLMLFIFIIEKMPHRIKVYSK